MWKQTLPRTRRGQESAPKLSSFSLSNIQHTENKTRNIFSIPGLRRHTARREISEDNRNIQNLESEYIWHDSKGPGMCLSNYTYLESRSPAFQTSHQLIAIPVPLPPRFNIIGRWLYDRQ